MQVCSSVLSLSQGSLEVVPEAVVECSVQGGRPLDSWQFERLGYFCLDQDSTPNKVCCPSISPSLPPSLSLSLPSPPNGLKLLCSSTNYFSVDGYTALHQVF